MKNKREFVCKERIKTGILVIFLEIFTISLFGIIALFESKFEFVNIIIPIFIAILFALILFTYIFGIRQYLGKININEENIVFYLNGKSYLIKKGSICIMKISLEIVMRFTSKKIYSVKIREKGCKNFIPVKITDEKIIKVLFSLLTVRREPQDFKFEWECLPDK